MPDSFGYICHHSWQAQRSWLNHRPPLTYHPNEFHLTCCGKEGEGADAQLLHVRLRSISLVAGVLNWTEEGQES